MHFSTLLKIVCACCMGWVSHDQVCSQVERSVLIPSSKSYAKQKHPGCKKSARPIRSSIANRYVRPKTLISVEAKKLLIKNLFNYLNDIQ